VALDVLLKLAPGEAICNACLAFAAPQTSRKCDASRPRSWPPAPRSCVRAVVCTGDVGDSVTFRCPANVRRERRGAEQSWVADRHRARSTPLLGSLYAASLLATMAYGEERLGRRTSTFSPTAITMRSSPSSSGPE